MSISHFNTEYFKFLLSKTLSYVRCIESPMIQSRIRAAAWKDNSMQYNISKLATATALAAVLAAPAFAQGRLIGTEALDDQIEEIERDVSTDLARGEDAQRFGPYNVPQGWRGSVALTGSASTGNTDVGDVSAAGRLTFGHGPYSHTFGLAFEYGEANGVKNEEKFFAIYEGSRYFTPEFYAFGVGRYEYDGFATNEHDAFIGVGPGYRVVNSENVTWRVQAGPGARFITPATGPATTEFAGIASSRLWFKINENVSLTNDTDVLGSDSNTLVTNDFGINVKMSDNLATRVSYRTDYNSDPLPGFVNTDNTIGVSLVVGF